MTRIEGLTDRGASWATRLVYRLARRRLGKLPEPLTVVSHHSTLTKGYVAFELAFDHARLVENKLKILAQIKAAALIGCPF